MLATPDEVEQGEAEGIIIHNSQAFARILSDDGLVTGVECLDIWSFEFDEEGKIHIDSIVGSEHVLSADTVIFAVGQTPDLSFVNGLTGLKVTKRQTFEVDPITMATGRDGVFAAGDVVTGPKSIVEAIGGGRRAAISIDSYLTGKTKEEILCILLNSEGKVSIERIEEREAGLQHVVTYDEMLNLDYFEKKPQVEMKRVLFPQSIREFEETNKGFTKGEAIEEASRCFHCGHCFQCETCVDVCPGDIYVMTDAGPEVLYPDECWHCGNCRISCPCRAISYVFPASMLV